MNNDGLSTANFLGGAMQGYQFMQGVDANKKQMSLADADESRRKESHAAQMESYAEQKKINAKRFDQLNDDDTRKMNEALAWSLHNAKDMPKEYQELIATHPNLNAQRIMSDEAGAHLDTLEKAVSGQVDYRSPEVAAAFDFLNPEISLGSTGGRKVKTARLYPGQTPETVMVGLRVDGDEKIRPLTQRRSADNDDPVREVPIELLVQRAQTMKQYRAMLADERGRQWLTKTYLPQSVQGVASAKDQSSINFNNARAEYYRNKTKEGGGGAGGSGGRLPADAQMIEYYISKGYSDDDAIAMTNNAVASPERFATAYSKMLFESSKDLDGKPTITPAQAMEQSMEIYKANFKSNPRKNGQDDEPQPASSASPNILNELSGVKPSPQAQPPMKAPAQPSAAAIKFLNENPDTADLFKAKYGQLPQGF